MPNETIDPGQVDVTFALPIGQNKWTAPDQSVPHRGAATIFIVITIYNTQI